MQITDALRSALVRTALIALLTAISGVTYGAIREPNPDDDFSLQEMMIPMRDGVTLHTLILTPKASRAPLPMLLSRTPYGAANRLRAKQQTHLLSVLGTSLAELHDYIFVFQDIRGRNGSGGEFLLARPTRGQFNTSPTDETTDAWDTVDWLVKNVVGNNGRVGIYGTSYDGWTALMALLEPHPALRAAVPVNPAVDFWMGDDWFHNGAFRPQYAFEYVHAMETDPSGWSPFAFNQHDMYSWWLSAGSPDDVGRRYLDPKRHKYWLQMTQHPTYDASWQRGALDRQLAASRAELVPTMHVHGWFDQEDIYGAPAAYAALESRDSANDRNFIVAGPWSHGQSWSTGDRLGAIAWGADTARHWRENLLVPFLDRQLKGTDAVRIGPAEVFNTGTLRWERLASWPGSAEVQPRKLYLQPGQHLSWQEPRARKGTAQTFVSDPAKPVPYQPRPTRRIFADELGYAAWRAWLVGDQRFVDGRPDVLTYVSEPLREAVTVSGGVTARLFAETTGTDADWVVKLIDVLPEQHAPEPTLSGYQLMISGNILRGRYREGFTQAQPIAPNQPLEYRFDLPHVNHTFKPGHRIMVQIQSTWFPLYDRNPQQFVPTLMAAQPSDYRVASHRIHTSELHPSSIELRVHMPH